MVLGYTLEKPAFMRDRLIYMAKSHCAGLIGGLLELFPGQSHLSMAACYVLKSEMPEKNFFMPGGPSN